MQVLIVEDNEKRWHFLKLCLSQFQPLRCDWASNEKEALWLSKNKAYDLWLLKDPMPETRSLELLAQMQAQGNTQGKRRVPAVVLVTSNDPKTKQMARDMGAYCLPAPGQAADICEAVATATKWQPTEKEGEGVERRRTRRVRATVRAVFTGGVERELSTYDVTPHGAFLVADGVEPVGSKGTLRIHFPHVQETITVPCIVAHVRKDPVAHLPAGFGVRFELTDAKVRIALERAFTWTGTDEGS